MVFHGIGRAEVDEMTDVAEAEALQEGMEMRAVIRLLEVTQFVEEDVIAEGFRETDEIEVQIDVAGTGTASPVGGVVLDGHFAELEAVLPCKIRQFLGQENLGLLTKHLGQDITKGLLRDNRRSTG